MPREVKAYACALGCGRRVLTSKKAMEAHEKICMNNPDRRACRTCQHDSTDGITRECEINARPADKAMIVECQSWSERQEC